MKTKAKLTIEVDLLSGVTKIATDGMEPMQAAVVLMQVATQLMVQNSGGKIISAPTRPIGVYTS